MKNLMMGIIARVVLVVGLIAVALSVLGCGSQAFDTDVKLYDRTGFVCDTEAIFMEAMSLHEEDATVRAARVNRKYGTAVCDSIHYVYMVHEHSLRDFDVDVKTYRVQKILVFAFILPKEGGTEHRVFIPEKPMVQYHAIELPGFQV